MPKLAAEPPPDPPSWPPRSRAPAAPQSTRVTRFGLLWLVFLLYIMALAVLRQPGGGAPLRTLAAYLGTVGLNFTLVRLAIGGQRPLWERLRNLLNGPILFGLIVLGGGFSSPAWMCGYPAVLGSGPHTLRGSTLIAGYLVAWMGAAYAVGGIADGDWIEAVGRGGLLVASAIFFRLIRQVEDEHRANAEEAARVAERARASKQEAEARFRLAEQSATHSKMASLGLLAASVAHEINNPINTIINSAQIIIDGDADDAGGEERFQRLIISEGERVARVVSNLLQFARGGGEEYGPTQLRRVVEKTLLLVQFQLEKDRIQVELDLPRDLPPARARLEELQQVYLNLITNARFALLERRRTEPGLPARIVISGRTEESDGGTMLVSSVRDNGTGMTPEVRARAFDPFFTTKPKEEGTGLGLSVCHRIIREHRGRIEVESVPGSETTFTIRVPALESGSLENSTGMRWSAIVP